MVTLLDFWKELVMLVGLIFSFIVGRKSAKLAEKKQQIEAIDLMQKTYDAFLIHHKDQYELISSQVGRLQNQLNDLQLQYAKEVEISQNWQRQYEEMKKKYESLEKFYEKLKNDFEKYKKENKPK